MIVRISNAIIKLFLDKKEPLKKTKKKTHKKIIINHQTNLILNDEDVSSLDVTSLFSRIISNLEINFMIILHLVESLVLYLRIKRSVTRLYC